MDASKQNWLHMPDESIYNLGIVSYTKGIAMVYSHTYPLSKTQRCYKRGSPTWISKHKYIAPPSLTVWGEDDT